MLSKKNRETIPPELAAKVLFFSDRTCWVCRVKGKPVQIHHIDENPANNFFHNLAVLCFDCHTETQISGGFHRKLNGDQVILYRDDWLAIVARQRAANTYRPQYIHPETQTVDVELATSIAEIYREREEYELLAMHYLGIGNDELRDKYIELAIEQGTDDDSIIFFRSEQNRLDLIPPEVLDRRINYLTNEEDWFNLGRLYRTLGDYRMAARVTSQGVIDAIDKGNVFSAAYHLKEMVQDGVLEELFTIFLGEARNRNDLWWQYRALEELGWDTEIKELVLKHREEIEMSEGSGLKEALALVLGDTQHYVELRKEEAREISAKPVDEEESE
jgi:hypothetical protein